MMMKQEVTGADTTNYNYNHNNNWARMCDTCRSAPCTVYCRADSAYLCTSCDTRIHGANQVAVASRHERVWVCEACESAPAAFLCKADAASLCAACDADIHSANPLARRHHRVPIMPLYYEDNKLLTPGADEEVDEDETASWLLLNPYPPGKKSNGNAFLFEGEVDRYLDLFDYNSAPENHFFTVPDKNSGGDSVVPGEGKEHQFQNFLFGMECNTKSPYNYATSIGHSVSVSSVDVGVVPESTISDLSLSHTKPTKGTIDLFSSTPIQMPTQLSPLDREARVMRYREKKKTRKFEKTIRYASRKAYAETRPRIKGRFAKRANMEAEIDQMFPNSLVEEGGYGIVPSF